MKCMNRGEGTNSKHIGVGVQKLTMEGSEMQKLRGTEKQTKDGGQ